MVNHEAEILSFAASVEKTMPSDYSHVPSAKCADCGEPVKLEIQQKFTQYMYGRVLCLDCEEKAEKL